jgi:hypothetical protein
MAAMPEVLTQSPRCVAALTPAYRPARRGPLVRLRDVPSQEVGAALSPGSFASPEDRPSPAPEVGAPATRAAAC